jgi:F-type H+-transporting ATPase subunit delta
MLIEAAQRQGARREHRRHLIYILRRVRSAFGDEDRVACAIRPRDVVTDVVEQQHALANVPVCEADPTRKARLFHNGHSDNASPGKFAIGKTEEVPVGRGIDAGDSVCHDGALDRRHGTRFRELAVKQKLAVASPQTPCYGPRNPWGRAGLSRCYAPFSHGAHFRFWSFSRVETSGGIRASLAGRYAIALFELARDQRQIESVGKSLDALSQALVDSKDFDELVTSPLVSREEALKSFEAIAPELGLDPITSNFLGVLARNGRKSQLQPVIRAFRRLTAEHRGETTAEVVTARPLNDDQLSKLRTQLRARAGREVNVDASVDPHILGGMVVRLGSQQIDASIRTKLNRLASAMKG